MYRFPRKTQADAKHTNTVLVQYKSWDRKGMSLFPICKVIFLVSQMMTVDKPIKSDYEDKTVFRVLSNYHVGH